MRATYKKPIVLGALWLVIFAVLTFVNFEGGGAGENAWIVGWGYPDWIGITNVRDEQYDFKPGEDQWEVLCSHWSRGVGYFDKIGFLFALSVAFAPIAIGVSIANLLKNGFGFQLSTLLVFVLTTGILIGVNLEFFRAYEWHWDSYSTYTWYLISRFTIPTVSAAITILFFAAVTDDWWSRRKSKPPAQV